MNKQQLLDEAELCGLRNPNAKDTADPPDISI